MEKQNWWKIALIALVAVLLFGLGFYIGRKKDPEIVIKEKIKYVELPPIHDTLYKPKPYKVVEPIDTANVIKQCVADGLYAELFPDRKDTVYVTKADTTAIMKDWATERRYKETLFDSDTLGRFSFDATVKYNRLQSFEYDFVPRQKQVETTVKTTRKYLPYVGAGLATDGSITGQGGMFFHQDAGFAVEYRYDTQQKKSSVGASFLYMF